MMAHYKKGSTDAGRAPPQQHQTQRRRDKTGRQGEGQDSMDMMRKRRMDDETKLGKIENKPPMPPMPFIQEAIARRLSFEFQMKQQQENAPMDRDKYSSPAQKQRDQQRRSLDSRSKFEFDQRQRMGGGNYYAGGKFLSSPPTNALPKPPRDWLCKDRPPRNLAATEMGATAMI